MNLRCLLASGALLMGASPLVSTFAASVNVQFGQNIYIGFGVAPSPQDLTGPPYWNFYNRNGARMLDVKDVKGQPSEVVIFARYASAFIGGGPATTTGGKGREPRHLLGSGLHGPIRFGMVFLDPKKTYDVYAYVYNKSSEHTIVTLTDAKGSTSLSPWRTGASFTEFVRDQNYVVFTDVVPGEHGDLELTVDGGWTGLNGLQFVEHDAQPTPTPTPAAEPPVLTIRGAGKPMPVVNGLPVMIRGTAASSIGIRNVRYSTNRKVWRTASGTVAWHFPVTVNKRTRIFVRAEDNAGRFSAVGNVVLAPRPGSGKR